MKNLVPIAAKIATVLTARKQTIVVAESSTAGLISAALLAVWWLGVSWEAMDWLGTALILATIVLLAKEETAEQLAEKAT